MFDNFQLKKACVQTVPNVFLLAYGPNRNMIATVLVWSCKIMGFPHEIEANNQSRIIVIQIVCLILFRYTVRPTIIIRYLCYYHVVTKLCPASQSNDSEIQYNLTQSYDWQYRTKLNSKTIMNFMTMHLISKQSNGCLQLSTIYK